MSRMVKPSTVCHPGRPRNHHMRGDKMKTKYRIKGRRDFSGAVGGKPQKKPWWCPFFYTMSGENWMLMDYAKNLITRDIANRTVHTWVEDYP